MNSLQIGRDHEMLPRMPHWCVALLIAKSVQPTRCNKYAFADQQTYIVHMDQTKIKASIHTQDSTKPWFESIIDFISESSMQEDDEEDILAPQLLYTYETSMFGFAVHLSKKKPPSEPKPSNPQITYKRKESYSAFEPES